jgi:hypothetical protein
MEKIAVPHKNSLLSKILFISGILVFLFWLAGRFIDVYQVAAIGAIFELLWLLMLLLLFVLPIISLIFLIKEKFNYRSLYLYTIIITVTNILLVIFIN